MEQTQVVVAESPSLQDENIQAVKKDISETILSELEKNNSKKGCEGEGLSVIKRLPTFTMSTCAKADTLVPVNLAGDILTAYIEMKEQGVNFDDYVIEHLKYTSKLALSNAFNAEQVDAIALAIYQSRRGKSLIIGDMAGIGKGRCAAALLRYAFINKKVPIFITEKTSLFSDIYRDIIAIGGFGTKANGTMLMPTPLIYNGYKSCNENDVMGSRREVLFEAQSNGEVLSALRTAVETGKFPFKEYQVIFATYSQFQTKNGADGELKPRIKLMEKIIPESYFVLDESHNAVGNTGTGTFFRDVVGAAYGTLFMSATSAKRAEHLYLYALRTDITNSSVGNKPDELLKMIKEGGEPMQEYLASTLTSCGQMIRRERSFENCPIEYKVIENTQEVFDLYDKTINMYARILNFSKYTIKSKEVLEKIIARAAAENGDIDVTTERPPTKKEDLDEWIQENLGRYVAYVDFQAIRSTRFMIIDNLVMAIKADAVADEAIKHLTEPRNYTYLDGTKKKTTIKPIIAVRSTNDALWSKVGIEIGDEIPNPDFKLFLEAALKSALKATIRFVKVEFEDEDDKKERKKQNAKKKKGDDSVIKSSQIVQYADFPDGGKELKEFEKTVSEFNTGIFVSPLDKIIDRVKATEKPREDRRGDGDDYLRVSEVSGRKFAVKNKLISPNGEQKDSSEAIKYAAQYKKGIQTVQEAVKVLLDNGWTNKYYLVKNGVADDGDKKGKCTDDKNVFEKFSGFNNGGYDMLIINEVGSTGASAQASKQYKDSRPRSMIVHQVELDINTEVQKRGRVNRTGQICLPTYTYMTSPIPSEIRRLLMLKRKLRSLDSITTGSQTQSDDLVSFKNKNGEVIQDFYNYIGHGLLQEFLIQPENDWFIKFFDDNADGAAKSSRKEGDESFIDHFCRLLEIAPSVKQLEFYDAMNTLYIKKVCELIDNDEFLLETTIDDFKASLKARAEIKFGVNTSPFNTSVFEEEYYAYVKNQPYTEEQKDSIINELCGGEKPHIWHRNFLTEYDKEFEQYLASVLINEYPIPEKEKGQSEENYQKIMADYESRKQDRISRETSQMVQIKSYLKAFEPNKPVRVPDGNDFKAWLGMNDDNSDTPSDKLEGSLVGSCHIYSGLFLGYKFDSKAKFKYSAGSIEFIFAFLSDKQKMVLKATSPDQQLLLDWIKHIRISKEAAVLINNWSVETKKRVPLRMLSGNILDALKMADIRHKNGSISSYKFIKYSTADNDIRSGVHIKFKTYEPLKVENIRPSIPSQTETFAKSVAALKDSEYAHVLNKARTERFVNNGADIVFTIFGERLIWDTKKLIFRGLERNAEMYKSAFFEDKNIDKFFPNGGRRFVPVDVNDRTYIDFTLVGSSGGHKSQHFHVFEYVVTEETDLVGLGKYMYSVDKSAYNFASAISSPENVRHQEDKPPAGGEGADDGTTEKKGDFLYYLTDKYNPTTIYKGKVEYINPDSANPHGVIRTNIMLTPLELLSYRLAPLNLTYTEMASSFFSKLNHKEAEDAIQEIKRLGESSGGDYFNLGLEVIKIASKKYSYTATVFGKLAASPDIVGEIMYKAIESGEVKLEEKTKTKAESKAQEKQKIEKKELSDITLQDYLTLLKA